MAESLVDTAPLAAEFGVVLTSVDDFARDMAKVSGHR